ncbi:MAG: SDR family NAD(P)-dependent oxidoreductase [Acidimicrobiia bacterium]
MNLGIDGRRAIVCGASSGIGLATAEALAGEGARVAMFARRRDVLEREAARIGGIAVVGDLSDPADLARLVDTTVESFGGIDILVNSGGWIDPGPAVGLTPEEVGHAVDLLLVSALRLTTFCLPHLRRSGQGRIVNISARAVREPNERMAAGAIARVGAVAWAKTLARELAPSGITVNTIATGAIATERSTETAAEAGFDLAAVPMGRMGEPWEMAQVVCFLASQGASYITGAVIPVDGGLTRFLL